MIPLEGDDYQEINRLLKQQGKKKGDEENEETKDAEENQQDDANGERKGDEGIYF